MERRCHRINLMEMLFNCTEENQKRSTNNKVLQRHSSNSSQTQTHGISRHRQMLSICSDAITSQGSNGEDEQSKQCNKAWHNTTQKKALSSYFAVAPRSGSTPDQQTHTNTTTGTIKQLSHRILQIGTMSSWVNSHRSGYTCSHTPQTKTVTTGQTIYGELHSWKLASSHTWNSGSNETKMFTVQRHTYIQPRNEPLQLPGSYIC